jgi:hypothetical protein
LSSRFSFISILNFSEVGLIPKSTGSAPGREYINYSLTGKVHELARHMEWVPKHFMHAAGGDLAQAKIPWRVGGI